MTIKWDGFGFAMVLAFLLIIGPATAEETAEMLVTGTLNSLYEIDPPESVNLGEFGIGNNWAVGTTYVSTNCPLVLQAMGTNSGKMALVYETGGFITPIKPLSSAIKVGASGYNPTPVLTGTMKTISNTISEGSEDTPIMIMFSQDVEFPEDFAGDYKIVVTFGTAPVIS